ncbi:MAG: hypothetical protein QOE70_6721 [Chthoniobacter sp.]|jgi:hypothetical protein|nr:hypothetical protein [Chthoniobacter sp.]
MIRRSRHRSAFTMIDCIFAVAIVGLFFGVIYSVCSQCMGLLNAGRDLNEAQQFSQQRVEQLRHSTWPQITDPAFLRDSVLGSIPAGQPIAGRVSETLTIDSYPTPATTPIRVSRLPTGAPAVLTSNTAIASAEMARVTLALSWPGRRGTKTRTIATTVLLPR